MHACMFVLSLPEMAKRRVDMTRTSGLMSIQTKWTEYRKSPPPLALGYRIHGAGGGPCDDITHVLAISRIYL